MKTVGINLLWLVPGVVGGSETSTITTLHAIADDPPTDLRYVLFALGPFIDAHPELSETYDVEVLPLSGRLKGLRVGAEQTWLGVRMRHHRVDAMHHMGGTMPLVPGPPGLLSIHDLQPFHHPENFHPAKRAWLRVVVPRSIARAALVLTPSEWVRSTVLDRFDVDSAKVVSVPHGVPPLPDPAPASEVCARHGIDRPFVLYPGITYPHKDHLTLLRAFSQIAENHPEIQLVLPGGPGPVEASVMAEAEHLRITDRVRRLGRIPIGDLVALIDEAELMAFPSRYEGFGMPLVEAMSRGCAVVAVDDTAVPEVVGDAAVLVPPGRVDALAQALDRLLSDPSERAALGERGRARAKAFDPRLNAAATVAAHRQILG